MSHARDRRHRDWPTRDVPPALVFEHAERRDRAAPQPASPGLCSGFVRVPPLAASGTQTLARIAAAARRRASRPTGSISVSRSLSSLGTGFAGRPGLPRGRDANPFRLPAQPAEPRSASERDPRAPKTPKAQPPLGELGRFDLRQDGGANRDRTGDLLLAKQALSQLSYGPKNPSLPGARQGAASVGRPTFIPTAPSASRTPTIAWQAGSRLNALLPLPLNRVAAFITPVAAPPTRGRARLGCNGAGSSV
jgi:hypothetical protein